MMKHLSAVLKVCVVMYLLGFGTMTTIHVVRQRDEMIQIEKMNTTLKAIEMQGNVRCEPS